MKLALIIDDYLPNSTRVAAKMFHELAMYLQLQGHQVTVITPNSEQVETLLTSTLDEVNIWRFKSGEIKNVGKVKRAINETLLSFQAWRAIQSRVSKNTFDGVIYYSPSIFWGGLVSFLKKRCQCKAYLVLRDLFPRWVIDAGMIKKGSVIERYFRFFEKYSYNQADMIGLMSENNINVFNMDYSGYSVEVLRNWAMLSPSTIFPDDYVSIRERLGLRGKVIFFYGGNIGHAQDMANLMRLTKKMTMYNNAHFIYIGQGDEVTLINQLSIDWGLKNFSYLPSVSQEEFKLVLSEVDIGLFSLSATHTSHNFPGKLLGYMVEAIPILGSVNDGNDLQDLVNTAHAGVIFINGEDDELFLAAEKLYLDTQCRHDMGKNSRRLLESEFLVSSVAKQIIKHLSAS
ncbi:glycosyltransferase family 4 protein [Aeromonas media]|uniref:glycosyltransferase family 4 protein n=1 Tax=Aeromonas media TaxID=651 RepID=UPI00227E5484|nr:glycosyltransferase family 4 protein [Aeromonas media]MCY9835628.1 glycosyltransferase family 4 protein [Aeromonas media]